MAWTTPRTWSTGEVVTASNMNTHVRDNLNSLRVIDYVEITSPVTITATSEGTATTIITGTSLTWNGTDKCWVECFVPQVDPTASYWARLLLVENSTVRGQWNLNQEQTAGYESGAILMRRRLTPAAGTYSITVKGYAEASGPVVNAGAGGSGQWMPAYLAIYGYAG